MSVHETGPNRIPPAEAIEGPHLPDLGGVAVPPRASLEPVQDQHLYTPLHPEQVMIDPLSAELGETREQVETPGPSATVSQGLPLSADEREERGIIDESRHTSSIGQR